MHALSRSPISDTHFYVSGKVVIDPSAAIAPGVLIQADSGAQVMIRAGVCIGLGSIIHAASGVIELQEGVTLGTGVLLFGQCSIGAGACVGANVTVIDHVVKAGQLVPANSVLSSLEIPSANVPKPVAATESPAVNGRSDSPNETLETESTQAENPADTPSEEATSSQSQPQDGVGAEVHSTEVNVTTQRVVYGRASLDQILTMMFPHRQPLESQSQSSSADPPDGSLSDTS